jgi:hypothetical protein
MRKDRMDTGNGPRQRQPSPSKVAKTARRGGQDKGDPVTVRSAESQHAQPNSPPSAAGPHNKPGAVNEHSTPGTGMLNEPGRASDDDMAPSG